MLVIESESESRSVMSNSLGPHGLGILQDRILEWLAFPFSRGSSQPRFPTLQVDSLPAETQGKPENTGVGSLSFLQEIFPTQESNRGLLHCRQILYQLSYQGSPGKFPDQGSNPGPQRGEPRVLATGLPGKSLTTVNIFAYVLYIHV